MSNNNSSGGIVIQKLDREKKFKEAEQQADKIENEFKKEWKGMDSIQKDIQDRLKQVRSTLGLDGNVEYKVQMDKYNSNSNNVED